VRQSLDELPQLRGLIDKSNQERDGRRKNADSEEFQQCWRNGMINCSLHCSLHTFVKISPNDHSVAEYRSNQSDRHSNVPRQLIEFVIAQGKYDAETDETRSKECQN
jgi:hypothetical protein